MDYPVSHIKLFNTDCPLYNIFVAVKVFLSLLQKAMDL